MAFVLLSADRYTPDQRANGPVFATPLKSLVSYYEFRGGFSVFYNDLKNKGIPVEIHQLFLELVITLAGTITGMPMKHIGNSVYGKHYSIYQYHRGERKRKGTIDTEYLIENFGTFSIPIEYYEAFQVLGSFINGQDAILFKWAEFSVQASGRQLSVAKVLDEVLKNPITERDIAALKNLYRSILQRDGRVYCVWSGDLISRYDIDHIIPFIVWKITIYGTCCL